MPRGRHRHSPPLHRLLPPLTVAGCAAALAAATLFTGDPGVLRVITVATALTACAGATLARAWDRSAGREVAELYAAQVREEWRTDERIAELETDLEESREIRGRLEKKLRSRRGDLARLRTEHADLLRRYATAESERARALESRRQLRLGTAQQPLAIAAGPAPVSPAAYLKADQALRDLSRNAARQQVLRTVEEARRRDVATPEEEAPGRHAAGGDHGRSAADEPTASSAGLPVREPRLIPAVAAAVLPYAQPPRSSAQHPAGHRAVGGFDFFGTQHPQGAQGDQRPALPGAPKPEAASAADDTEDDRAAAPADGHEHGHEHAQAAEAGEVIDLTAHDETEQFDVTELRAKA